MNHNREGLIDDVEGWISDTPTKNSLSLLKLTSFLHCSLLGEKCRQHTTVRIALWVIFSAGTSGWTSQLCWCWRQDDINPFLNLLLFMVQRNYFQLYIGAPGSNFKRIQNMSMSERVSFHHYCEDSSDLAQFISGPVPFKIVVTDMTYVDIIYILKCSSTVPQSITMRLICS